MQNMIIPLEQKYVLLLNPANDDLSGPESANPLHRGSPRPQKQNEISSNITLESRRSKPLHKAQPRGRGFVIPPTESPACDTFTRVIFPRYGRTTKDEYRFVKTHSEIKLLDFDSKSQLSQTSKVTENLSKFDSGLGEVNNIF